MPKTGRASAQQCDVDDDDFVILTILSYPSPAKPFMLVSQRILDSLPSLFADAISQPYRRARPSVCDLLPSASRSSTSRRCASTHASTKSPAPPRHRSKVQRAPHPRQSSTPGPQGPHHVSLAEAGGSSLHDGVVRYAMRPDGSGAIHSFDTEDEAAAKKPDSVDKVCAAMGLKK